MRLTLVPPLARVAVADSEADADVAVVDAVADVQGAEVVEAEDVVIDNWSLRPCGITVNWRRLKNEDNGGIRPAPDVGSQVRPDALRSCECPKTEKDSKMAEAKHGDHVKVHYTGKLADGSTFDSSADKDPMEVTIGSNKTFIDIEQALVGMSPGESKTITIGSEKGFGARREDLIVDISTANIAPGIKPEVGQRLEASRGPDTKTVVTVVAVNESAVTVDANHPLAGEDLIFDLELVEIT